MTDGARDLGPLREAMRLRVCPLCLDGSENGVCHLSPDRHCPLDTHLQQIVDAILSVRSRRIGDYLEAVEREVCSRCETPGADGGCRLRDRGECSLCLYLPLVIEAVEDVTGQSLVDV